MINIEEFCETAHRKIGRDGAVGELEARRMIRDDETERRFTKEFYGLIEQWKSAGGGRGGPEQHIGSGEMVEQQRQLVGPTARHLNTMDEKGIKRE